MIEQSEDDEDLSDCDLDLCEVDPEGYEIFDSFEDFVIYEQFAIEHDATRYARAARDA